MEFFLNKDVVITEKIDGSNTCITEGQVYARSVSSPSHNKWFAMVKKHHAYKVTNPGLKLYGEDIFGVHSIEYDPVEEDKTFYAFGLANQTEFLSWSDLANYCNMWAIPVVPVIFQGKFSSITSLKEFFESEHRKPSFLGNEREGMVIRVASAFKTDQFDMNVAKSVRPNHVQTDKHWRYHWKCCKLKKSTV